MEQDNLNHVGTGTSRASGSSGIEFEDSGWRAIKYYREPTAPKMIQFVVDHSGGLIKNENRARYFILCFVVVAIIISLFLFFGSGGQINQDIIIRPAI